MRPDIGAIEIHENSDVANDANRTLRTVRAQSAPLLEEKKLYHATGIEIVSHLGIDLFDRGRISMDQFARPAIPGLQIEARA